MDSSTPTLVADSVVELVAHLGRRGVRLWADGDNLRFRAPSGALTPELKTELGRRKRDVLAFLATARASVVRADEVPLEPVPRDGEELPLSFAQERLWLIDRLDPGNASYNIYDALELIGDLRPSGLERGLEEIFARHEVLRTTIRSRGGDPIPHVEAPGPVEVPRVDLGALDDADRSRETRRLLDREAGRGFDLSRGPMLRTYLLRHGSDRHVLLFNMHHIVSDGWSTGVLVMELAALYRSLTTGRPTPLPPLPIQYADYAAWQRRWLTDERLEEQMDFWRDVLADRPDSLDLPVDRPHPPVRSSRGATHRFTVSPDVTDAVARFARRRGVTPFAVLLGAFACVLRRWSGRSDLVIGSPSANRDRTEIEGLIGFFVNTLALRVDLRGASGFDVVVDRVSRRVLEAQEHRDLPFEKLVEEIAPERNLSRTPVFQTMFVFQNAPDAEMSAPGLELRRLELEGGTTKMDLTLSLTDAKPALTAEVEYATDLFDATTVARLMGHYRRFLEDALARPGVPLHELSYLPPAERHQVICEWSDGPGELPADRRVDELIALQADSRPEAVAVKLGRQHVTFGELHRRAAALTARLRRMGAGPETAVAIFLDRGPETLIAILGVLGTGGAYVPLDPDYPEDRLRFMLEEPDADVVVTLERYRTRVEGLGVQVVSLDRIEPAVDALSVPALPARTELDARAYVIYTSGSMGRPKGVVNSHRSLAAFARHYRERSGHGPGDRHLLVLSFAFDASLGGVFPTLVGGGTLVLHPKPSELPPRELTRLFEREQITCADLPVPLWNHWVEEMEAEAEGADGADRGALRLPALRFVVAGGEPVYRDRLNEWTRLTGKDFWGAYGPTETTVAATLERTEGGAAVPPGRTRLPVGRPLPGVRARLLDDRLEPVPVGVPGEICLAGRHLTRGYLNDPAKTAARFVPDPRGGAGDRMYRTGDFARHLADGRVEFLSRRDTQIKIRGFRVEPSEVEAVLARHPKVALAAVVPVDSSDSNGSGGDSGSQWLAAYVANPGAGRPVAEELRAFLQDALPEYMIPGAFVVLDDLPRNPASGKVDVSALPTPERRGSDEAAVAPRTETEQILATLWSEVLGVETVGVRDDFFRLGGHSLLATRLLSRVGDAFGVDVPLRGLFEGPTVEALARRVDRLRESGPGTAPPPIERVPRDGPLPASYSQERMWLFEQLHPGTPTYNTYRAGHAWGPLSVAAAEASYEGLVRRHEALRTRYVEADGGAAQVVEPHRPSPLPVVDLQGLTEGERQSQAFRLAQEDAAHPISLESAPVSRARLLRLDDREHVFLLSIHHIAYDLWSGGILLEEIEQLYLAHRDGRPDGLPPPPVQYADFAVWQRRWLTGDVWDAQRAYWRERLEGLRDDPMELPSDRPRAAQAEHRGHSIYPRLGSDLTESLWELARRRNATQFMATLAVFKAVLARWTGHHHVTVGTFMVNRNRSELERVVGYFDNTIVLHTDVAGEPTFLELLDRVRTTTLGAHAHQYLPYETLMAELGAGDPQPLFRVAFIFELNYPAMERELAGLQVVPYNTHSGTAKFDLSLGFRDGPEGLVGEMELDTDLFDVTTIHRLAVHFRTLLTGAVADPERRLSELPLLSPAETHQLRFAWNDTESPVVTQKIARGLRLHDLFEAQAARTPEAEALRHRGDVWTYERLARRARRLARRLQAAGVEPDRPVGIALERDPDLPAALLAVLMAGGAYVPLDPSYPEERLRFILQDTGAPVVLAAGAGRERLEAVVAGLDAPPEVLDPTSQSAKAESETEPEPVVSAATPENVAYLIYTSGSMGRPKGVTITHGSAVELVRWAGRVFDSEDLSGMLASTSINFDLSVFEIFTPLAYGGTVLLVKDALELPSMADRERVRTVNTVPSAMTELVRAGALPSTVRTVNLAGEPFPRTLAEDLDALGSVRRMFNLYGPSEDTTYSTWSRVRADGGEPTIGRPVDGTRAWVVDGRLRPTPPGVPGELLLGGAGLARGYWNRPERTAAAFVPDAFSDPSQASGEPGARVYRTGDLVRYRSDGELEFLGRLDHQVKVRGFRIELGEIESALEALPGVRGAVVLAPGSGAERRLAAYVTVEPDGPSAADLRAGLEERLPRYMVPQSFAFLEAFPLTPNGKVDRRALAKLETQASDVETSGSGYVPPADAVEEVLAEMWSDLLGRDRVGRTDDFLALGGHSLLATRLATRVREAFGVEPSLHRLFATRTLAGLADEVRRARSRPDAQAPPLEPLPPESRREPLPASFAQSRLWFLDRLEQARAAYNIPGAVGVRGSVDVERLRQVFTETVRRHEILRTTLGGEVRRPVQIVHPATATRLPVVDLRRLDPRAIRREALRRVDDDASRPFDLEAGPLVRFRLLRQAGDDHVLLLTQHHAVSDGWSLGILLGELKALHEAYAEGRPSPLEELPIQYADYAAWQRSWLTGDVLDAEVEHWRERLAGAPDLLELPTDRPRPPVQSYRGRTLSVALAPDVTAEVVAAARSRSASVFMVLLAAFQLHLGRHAGQDDVVVGTPVAGRHRRETEDLIGFFVNTLALRGDLSGSPTFADLIARVRRETLDAYAHQDVPFERLVEELVDRRSLSHAPLFQVMLALQNDPASAAAPAGLELEPLDAESGTAKFDLLLSLDATDDGIRGSLEYATDLFDATTVRRLWERFTVLVGHAAAAPERPVDALDWMSAAERHQIVVEDHPTRHDVGDATLWERFADQATRRPEAVVLVDGLHHVTYGALLRSARRGAGVLEARGVRPGERVGLWVDRTADGVRALLSALAVGAAYVPLDPSYPEERVAHILEDAAPRVVLRPADLSGPDGAESAPPNATSATPEHPAYVIYTSGSTGRPKGVEVSHRHVLRLLAATERDFGFGPDDVTTLFHSLAFDFSVWELWGALAYGGRLVLVSRDLSLAPDRFRDLLADEQVTVLNQTPSAFRPLAAWDARTGGGLPALRRVVFGGEALDVQTLRGWWERHDEASPRLVNMYGITETTVHVTYRPLGPSDMERPGSRVGRPLGDLSVRLLDAALRPVPYGVVGEIAVGGAGVTRGYLNRPALTAERFVPDPFSDEPGARLYRSGDLARRRPDGDLEYLRRKDRQIQIRGFRVEPGEIEAALEACEAVRDGAVVVVDRGDGDLRLAAFAVPELDPPGLDGVRRELERRLPPYMTPDRIHSLDALPLTSHGKLDRDRLTALAMERWSDRADTNARVEPRDDLEHALAAIWTDLLEVEEISVTDGFFALGGHSLLAVEAVLRIRRDLGAELPVTALFEHPTVRELADVLRRDATDAERRGILVPLSAGEAHEQENEPLLVLIHPVGGNVTCYAELVRRLPATWPIYGIRAPRTDGDEAGSSESLEDRVTAYLDALGAVYDGGPIWLAGWSLGGVFAFEMAHRLAARGETVHLAMLDSRPPEHLKDLADGALLGAFAEDVAGLLDVSLEIPDGDPASPHELFERWRPRLPDGLETRDLAALYATFRRNVELAAAYRPRRWPGRLWLAAAGRGDGPGTAPDRGWAAWAETVEGVEIDADHHGLLRPPAVDRVARHLEALRRSRYNERS